METGKASVLRFERVIPSPQARLLAALEGTYRLMGNLLYGSGMRLMECLRLRVNDVDFGQNHIVVRDGKGFKDRVTRLPQSLVAPLQAHLERVRLLHQQDLIVVAVPHSAVRVPHSAACQRRADLHRRVGVRTIGPEPTGQPCVLTPALRFMESLDANLGAHWDHEPQKGVSSGRRWPKPPENSRLKRAFYPVTQMPLKGYFVADAQRHPKSRFFV